MKQIKLIIWDLDDTFWSGTLSEEGITILQTNIDFVIETSKRGIIHSISSKNDYDRAKEKLEELDVWSYFVFPKIGWFSKGYAIKDTLEEMGLRPQNVLFIDDNHLNLIEASKIVEGLEVIHPNDISYIQSNFDIEGKDDESLSRLKQYKILEEKVESKAAYKTDLEFLRSCQIKVNIERACISDLKRVHEMITRTNQLNFTKIRLSMSETEKVLLDEELSSYIIRVRDNYGDYGVVGFVSIQEKDNTALHYCFSCRTINLGVEQFVYKHFNCPKVSVVGETVSSLSTDVRVDWVSLSEELLQIDNNNRENKKKILFKGGCDLSSMMYYLSSKNEIIEETNFVTEDNLSVHAEHSLILSGRTRIEYANSMPYLPKQAFETDFFNKNYDVVIYSLLMDYTQDIYVDSKGSKIPFGGYNIKPDISNMTFENKKMMNEFYDKYHNSGQISAVELKANLNLILEKLNDEVRLIFINGAEVLRSDDIDDVKAYNRHKHINTVIDEFVLENQDRVKLLDVRGIVKSKNDVTDNIRHYTRESYKRMSDELALLVDLEVKKGNIHILYFISKIRNKIKKIMSKFSKN
ncbi:hypothetical protein AB6F11_08160 [Vibrio sp. 10N.247.311.14]|uniref:hypothetical protein n=1 Tax=Vibrio sp. 10N.247.311.14 TaxID=3229994 RepID=UPI00354E0770